MTNPTDEARQALNEAIDLLREKGWVKGTEYDGRSYCMFGALRQATEKNKSKSYRNRYSIPSALYIAASACARVIQKLPGCSRMRGYNPHTHANSVITSWNDMIAQNVDEVIDVLKLAQDEVTEVTPPTGPKLAKLAPTGDEIFGEPF